jgi:predicted glycosyltransferase involved in capsule biosynthesis
MNLLRLVGLMNNISFIIPYKEEPIREVLFYYVINRIKMLFPKSEIVIGRYDKEPFSRGKAINNGVKKSKNEILFICDADFVFEKSLVTKSVELLNEAPWVIPFGYAYNLDFKSTEKILESGFNTNIKDLELKGEKNEHMGLGSMTVIKRKDFDLIGGFDENLVGWGFEDNVFTHIANTILGIYKRVNAPILHLWHPYSPNYRNEDIIQKNYKYFLKVLQKRKKDEMLEFIKRRDTNES